MEEVKFVISYFFFFFSISDDAPIENEVSGFFFHATVNACFWWQNFWRSMLLEAMRTGNSEH